MKNANEIIKNVMHGLVNAMLNNDPGEWPPIRSLIIYQPQRPSIQKSDSDTGSK